jgi:hypothetical protein
LAAAQLRHTPIGRWHRFALHPGVTGSQEFKNYGDIHAC